MHPAICDNYMSQNLHDYVIFFSLFATITQFCLGVPMFMKAQGEGMAMFMKAQGERSSHEKRVTTSKLSSADKWPEVSSLFY